MKFFISLIFLLILTDSFVYADQDDLRWSALGTPRIYTYPQIVTKQTETPQKDIIIVVTDAAPSYATTGSIIAALELALEYLKSPPVQSAIRNFPSKEQDMTFIEKALEELKEIEK